MKLKQYLLPVVLLLSLAGCSTVEPTIASGTYLNDSTPNFITVSAKQMRVHIEGVDKRDADRSGLLFDYGLLSDGRVYLIVQRSSEVLYGYPSLDYRWDSEKIIAKIPKTELQWIFLRRVK